MNSPDKDEFLDWLQQPVTEAYMNFLKEQIAVRKEIVAEGSILMADNFESMGQKYFAQMNIINVYESMLEDISIENGYEILFPKPEEEEKLDEFEGEEDTRQPPTD